MLFRISTLAVALVALVGCAPGFSDSGNASLTLTVEGEEPITLVYDPLRSQLSVSPPVEGEVQISFTNNDPFVSVDLRVNSNVVSEGESVGLPPSGSVTDNDLNVQVEVSGEVYESDDATASGNVSFPVLYVDDSYADIQVDLNATLVGGAGSLEIDGTMEGEGGTPPSSTDGSSAVVTTE